MKKALLALTAAAILLVPPPARAGDVEELQAIFERSVKALNARDLDGFLATVHEKGLSFYSCGPSSGLEGRAACQQDWQKFFAKTPNATFTPHNFQYRVIGNTGIAWGQYTVELQGKKGPQKVLSGRYTLIYTRVDGKWLVVFQENSPDPIPAQPTTTSSVTGNQ